jgi:hypothetical protein
MSVESPIDWARIGRYLAALPQVACQLDGQGQIPEAMRAKLVESLRQRVAV